MRRLIVVAVAALAACVMPALAAETPKAEDAAKPAAEFAALPKGVRERVEDLSARLRKEVADLWSTPPGGPRIDARKELESFCAASDLVELIGASQAELRQPACELLLESRNKDLRAKDIERLCQYLEPTDPAKNGQGQQAGSVLARNQALGIPALVGLLKTAKNPVGRVHAAYALSEAEAVLEEPVKGQAQEVLLKSLGNVEPWMIPGLAKALLAAKDDSPLWPAGSHVLCYGDRKGQEALLRPVFLRAMKNPSAAVRTDALIALQGLGPKKEDLAFYQAARKDAHAGVRHRLYILLGQEHLDWMIPMMMDGLAEAEGESLSSCAWGLAVAKHKAAVPKLAEVLKKAMAGEKDPFDGVYSPYAAIGKAISTLTGEHFDFELRTRPAGLATAIVLRPGEYKAEATRLLKWWDETGSKQEWK